MMQWLYLMGLVVSIGCLALIDWRYRLAYWHDRRRTITTLAIEVVVFVLWDILGIRLGIFFHGQSPYTLPLRLLPEFPVEELFFLVLLCYSALLIYVGSEKLWKRT